MFLARRLLLLCAVAGFAIGALPLSAVAQPSAPQAQSRVSLRAQNEPVRAVLMRLAHKSGANIVVGEGVTGYVTLEMHGVTLAQALRAILEPLGATYRLRDGIYEVDIATGGAPRAAGGTAPVVIPLAVVTAKRAAAIVRPLFPQASIREDARANALIVLAPPADVQSMKTVLQGIDVRDPSTAVTEALPLRVIRAGSIADQLRKSFPKARFGVAGERQLLVTATPADLAQIKTAVAGLDAPLLTPPPVAAVSEAVPISRRAPRDVARAIAAQVPGVHASVSGAAVVLSGPADAVQRAKALVAQVDLPSFGERYTQVYRIRTLDASSVADLLRRSFRDLDVTVDASLNAIAVTATAAQQQRIADAVTQLDAPAAAQGGGLVAAQGAGGGGGSTDVVTLKSYIPGQSQGGVDAVTSFTQALQVIAPDVRVVQLPTPGQIALVGPPTSVRTARQFIDKVDVVAPLVVLDTEVLEVDETVAKNLGLQLGTAVISSTFTEVPPTPNPDGSPPRLGQFQALTRTPISFTAQLNLLVQNGKGRVLADPRITTLSGRTATIRAGDTISILTTTAGNSGTIATTQVQSFQTGVTLDITPSVTPDGGVTVVLHPVVNSLIGTNAGVPEISTRDTQTTVHLQDDETLVIGGLIQENDTRTTTKVPFLGDLPLVGRVFRNENVQSQRNELIIVVTPHILKPGKAALPGPALRAIPTPAPLPTLPPNTHLPPPSGQIAAPPPAPGRRGGRVPGGTVVAPPVAPSSTLTPPPASPSPAPPLLRPDATPSPVPSAFAQTNVFTFGSPPQSNFAKPTDPVQIFFATLSPTVVSNGTSVRAAAVTTTNATALKLQIGTQTIGFSQTGLGQWQAVFPFPLAAVPVGQTTVSALLVASRSDGSSASVPVPFNVASP
ncbi:MAG: ral secretion pathway protein [Candidatus Eremiobacteraeota bacterium]|nr:ral secretion pathway protein [Candidatus Eremiobacteraeota bacterium]